MEKKKDTAERCPLCDSKLNLPSYKCRNCDIYLTEREVIKEGSGTARCPNCKLKLNQVSKKEIKKEYTCKECGYSFEEAKGPKEIVKIQSKMPNKEELQILESELEALSLELDKILDVPAE
ncbi:MAG: hypothetical protein JSV09_10600, partial [Thermoplasmata archaeon]